MVVVADGAELRRSLRLSPGGTTVVVEKKKQRTETTRCKRQRHKRMRNAEGRVVSASRRALIMTNIEDNTDTNDRANERSMTANKEYTETAGSKVLQQKKGGAKTTGLGKKDKSNKANKSN